ncbi:hypothetical protein Tco_0557076 [Tanacetum coccineum]
MPLQESTLWTETHSKSMDILKKHGIEKCDNIGKPMATSPKLDADLSATPIDQRKDHSMIGSLMYMTASRPDLVHATCYYARYQARSTQNHLKRVKRIFQYLMKTINMNLSMLRYQQDVLKSFGCGLSLQIMALTSTNTNVLRLEVKKDIFELYFVINEYKLADIFTKAPSKERFEYLVMAFSIISISSDTLKESVGTSTARVILFGMIFVTIPSTAPIVDLPINHDDTLLIPTDTPTISPVIPTIPPIAPTIKYTSSFICTDSSDSDTLDLPPSQDPYEVNVARWRSRPIPVGRPYRTQPNKVLQMLTASKRIEPLPTHRLTLKYSTDYSSSDQFTLDDLSRDSLSDSLSETSLDSYSDSSSDSSSRHSSSGYVISETPYDSPTATSKRPSRKICRSPTSSTPVSSPVHGALSHVRVDLSPPPKRIRDSDLVKDLEVSSEDGYEPYVPREVGLGVDVEDNYEPYTEPDVDSDVQAYIDECIAYADAIRARGMDDRAMVKTTAIEEVDSNARGIIKVEVDPRVRPVIDYNVCESVREDVPDHVTTDGVVEVIKSEQRLQGHRIVGVDLEVTTMTERISAMGRTTRGLEACWISRVRETIPTTTRTRMTQDAINELIAMRVDEALKAYDTGRNPVTKAEIENEQQDDHVEGDVNNGNGNGNGNGNHNVNNRGVVPIARECTYQDFVKCQPLNFKGT